MKGLFITLIIVGQVASQGLALPLDLCANPPKTPPKPLSDKIALLGDYKISGSITDWATSQTSLLMESYIKDQYRMLQRQSRGQLAERWIQTFNGSGSTVFVNVTSGECNADAPQVNLIKVPRFKSLLQDASSIYSIIQGLAVFAKSKQGFVVEPEEVVGGVSSTKWIACIDGANASDTKVLLEVRYAGDGGISPADELFANPLILSIRLAELDSFNSTGARNHISLEFDRYEHPMKNEFLLEHGIVCTYQNSSSNITLKAMDEYAAHLNYYDHTTNRSELLEILYSRSRKVFIVAGDSLDAGVRIFNTKTTRYNNSDYILHDFKYGYEFTTLNGACTTFSTLTDFTADVQHAENNTLAMAPLKGLLIDGGYNWQEYEGDTDIFGNRYKTYRGSNAASSTNAELHLTADGDIHSMAVYRKGTRELTITLTVTSFPIESSRLFLGLEALQLSSCYSSRDNDKFANNTWIVPIKDKTLSDLKKVGLHRLNYAVVTSINTVYPVIPYRIVVFWIENKSGGLSMTLRLAEKTEVQPADVGYDFSTELATVEIFQRLNKTMLADKMPIVVEVKGVKEEWKADATAMKMFPPENDSGFLGYTGGAMFVLAIFCLLIGVSVGALGVFVATRRQRISTLAYQVFE